MSAQAQVPQHTNRLAKEKSPYLLQHAHNPVDWYAWGEEAFEKARKEDKPILLSIGYSTCHWCHVMEEESFEDEATAALMNRHFVPIKVDREERPDIDSVYMSYVTAVTGSGGWPMTVFLTGDKKPFFGGTYFPPEDRYGMPGFPSLLTQIADSWKTRRDEILRSADSAVLFLNDQPKTEGSMTDLSVDTLFQAYARFDAAFDGQFAGFGAAPKFPRSHSLSFLLRHWTRTREPRALEMVEKTLKAMARGGMYDQLGGGFHRYSVDSRWRVPHFEKMLYDQALLVITYVEAYQATGDPFYERIARQTLAYVSERMTAPEGGFYSAEDADSADPHAPGKKREGAYFVWKKEEIEKLLGGEAAAFDSYYGIEAAGNALSDPYGEFKDQNVLHVARTAKPEEEASLDRWRQALLKARALRQPPHLDDKVLADWNGLMIAAYAQAGLVFKEPEYIERARKAAEFIRTNLVGSPLVGDQNGRAQGPPLHRYRDGEAGIDASLNDHAFLILGYLRLYEASFDEKWLREAKSLADAMLERFQDKDHGGFFLTASDGESLILRPKEVYDGAIPSGNSVAALGLLMLGRFTGETKYEDASRSTLAAFAGALSHDPANYPQMLIALDFAIGPSSEIVLEGKPGEDTVEAFRQVIYSRFLPNKIVRFKPSAQAAATVCRNHACGLPVTDPAALAKMIETDGERE